MNINDIKPGVIIKSRLWNEPVEIRNVNKINDDYFEIIGVTIYSNESINDLISRDQLSFFEFNRIEILMNSPCINVFLALEAKRYRYASLYDPLLAINISKVDPLPHQIEAVYGYILKLPRIRFLIADDAGSGKTIMAGLVLKELKLRNLIQKILIIAPGHLKDQWRRELTERFKEHFVIIDRSILKAHYGQNVWEKENQIITSMDFIKQDDIISTMSSVSFDLVIVDEAHKMSAYVYGDKTYKTKRYKLGEKISKNAEHLLFLTATPNKGDPENFRLFLDLLEPGFFATRDMMENSLKNKDNPLFIKRIKEDLRDFEGKPLFLPRNVKTIAFRLSPEEKDLYNNVSRYVKEQYNKALSRDKKRNITFALIILQRRLASSVYALHKSLQRRKNRLQELLEQTEFPVFSKLRHGDNWEELEDWNEEERWKEEALWETLSVAQNRRELEEEINILKDLIQQAITIINSEKEIKISELKKTLNDLKDRFPREKIIIFTESKDTLEYLEQRIKTWGYKVNTIHGGMSLEERVNAEKIFKNETQILVATEAAGEGINLQFCHLMINYDIPWNPNRLEQRMGRIHRYGQQKEVFIFNLVAEDTREGQVLKKLFDKLEEIKNALGRDKVFDVISDVYHGIDLSRLLLEAAASARNIDQIIQELDLVIDEQYINQIRENLGDSLATKFIDYTRIKDMANKAREFKLIPEYTEAFFLKAFSLLEGRYRRLKDDLIAIDFIPHELRIIAEEERFKRRFGSLLDRYPRITFDKEIAFRNPDIEFVSFDHPLFEAVIE
ncbi:MAG: DEAD/DEAH box helicase, partial [Promethearchaeota archaeon]